MAAIKIDNISFSYADSAPAVLNVTAFFQPGETAALIGANGAGKTTLARLIKGILVPAAGKIFIDGWDTALVPVSRLASKVGYVFTDPRLQIFTTSVREEVAFGPRNLGWDCEAVDEALHEALQVTELLDKAAVHPYELGRNERRRLALASVLAMRCPVIILDEPTAGIDRQTYRCLNNVVELLKQRLTTLIIISHDTDFVAATCSRVLAMQKGRLVQDGPLNEVLAQAADYDQDLPCTARICRALQIPDRYSPADFLSAF